MGAPIYRAREGFVLCLERLCVSGRDGSGGSEQARYDRVGKLGESSSLSCVIWKTVGMLRG